MDEALDWPLAVVLNEAERRAIRPDANVPVTAATRLPLAGIRTSLTSGDQCCCLSQCLVLPPPH